MRGCPCLVVGGGRIATGKVRALLACGARVQVVSPTLNPGLRRLFERKKIRWEKRFFKASDLNGVLLAVAATDQQPVNEAVSRAARRKGIWVNVVDRPELCSFIYPSVVRRGKLVVAISTGGASPALAKWIRRDLESRYGPELGRLLASAARARGPVLKRVRSPAARKRLFEKALNAYLQVLKPA